MAAEHVFTNLQGAVELNGGFIQFPCRVIQHSDIVQNAGVLGTARAARLLYQPESSLVLGTGFDKIPENAIYHCQVVPHGGLNSWIRRHILASQRELIDGFCFSIAAGLNQAIAFPRMLFPARLLAESNPDNPQQERASHLLTPSPTALGLNAISATVVIVPPDETLRTRPYPAMYRLPELSIAGKSQPPLALY
jgi:hypothetical protein